MRVFSFFLLLTLWLTSVGHAQSVQQSGNVTPGHVTSWTTTGVVQDAGTAASGSLTSLGVTASGQAICQNSDAVTAAGWQTVCIGATTAGGAEISATNNGTASSLPLSITGVGAQLPAALFATLPTCASALKGTLATVSNSSTSTWGATITAGGSSTVLAFCNGTNWTVAAK